MSDNLENRGPQDAARINVNESWELTYWSKKFGVSVDELKAAVESVGASSEKVAALIQKR